MTFLTIWLPVITGTQELVVEYEKQTKITKILPLQTEIHSIEMKDSFALHMWLHVVLKNNYIHHTTLVFHI